MIQLRANYAAANRIIVAIGHPNQREAPVEAEAEPAEVAPGVLAIVEGIKSAAEAGLLFAHQSVDLSGLR